MEPVSEFLQQAYWWLSLLGGMHCAALALLLWVKGKAHNSQHMMVVGIFITLSIYFFTGIINRENAPLPIHMILALITPLYFLLLPLVYLYCKKELNGNLQYHRETLLRHFVPAIAVALIVLAFALTHFNTNAYLQSEASVDQGIASFTLLGMLLPALLLLQTGVYFFVIIKMLRNKGRPASDLPYSAIDALKIRWLLVVTLAIIVNWLIRCALAGLPFLFGDEYLLISQTATRLSLLMTLYILAIYRLQQLTVIAYQNGLVAQKHGTKETAVADILDNDEKAYLSSVFKDTQSK